VVIAMAKKKMAYIKPADDWIEQLLLDLVRKHVPDDQTIAVMAWLTSRADAWRVVQRMRIT
jgi:hypothetical protein